MKMIIQEEDNPEILAWATNAANHGRGAGSFVRAIGEAALRADCDNYPILRPALLEFVAKYPAYKTPGVGGE